MEKRHMGIDCLNGDMAIHQYNIHNNLCCFRLMHLRTGGMIVAYVEFMLLTSLISYVAARSVVQGYSHSLIVLGILCAMQAFFAFSLVWGIKRERLKFLLISLASVGLRLLFVVTYLFAIAAAHIVPVRGGSFLEQNVILNTILSVTFLIVYGFCISVITRLHAYYSQLHIIILSDNAKKRRCSSCSTDMHYMKHLSNQYTTSVLQETDTGEMIARRLSAAEQCSLINTRERLKNSAVDNILYENSEDSENE